MQNESGFTPNGNLVLVLPSEINRKTPGGIELPDTVLDKEKLATRLAKVIAIGDIAAQHPRMKGIKAGDMILFPRYAGDPLPVGGKMYIILRDEAVLGPMTKLPDYDINAAKSTYETFGANMAA